MCTAICSPAVAQRCPFYSQEPRAKSSFSRLIWPPVLQMCSEPTVSRSSAGRAASGRRQCFAPCLLHTCTHPLGVPLFAGNVVSRRPRRTAAHGDGGQGGGRAVRPRRRRGCLRDRWRFAMRQVVRRSPWLLESDAGALTTTDCAATRNARAPVATVTAPAAPSAAIDTADTCQAITASVTARPRVTERRAERGAVRCAESVEGGGLRHGMHVCRTTQQPRTSDADGGSSIEY